MRHVFPNEFYKHFSILKSPSELWYIKLSVGDFFVSMGTEVPVPFWGSWGRRYLSPFACFRKNRLFRGFLGTEVPVPSVPLRLPYQFNRQQASLFCLKNIQSGVVVATWNIFANYFARCCITGNKAKVHQLITVACRSNNDI